MQSDQFAGYAVKLAADAKRYKAPLGNQVKTAIG